MHDDQNGSYALSVTPQLERDLVLLFKFLLLFLISAVCSEYNHVRTWGVTRFRGMISTQPGSTPLASFKVLSLEESEAHVSYAAGNDIGKLNYTTYRLDTTNAMLHTFLYRNHNFGANFFHI